MFLNCGVGEHSWESLGLQEIQSVHHKGNQSRVFIGRTDAEAETTILWPPDAKNWLIRKDWRERLKAGGEGDDRGWDVWMASSTQWTWVWANSGIWWWTGKPGVLPSMGLQRVGHDWTELIIHFHTYCRNNSLESCVSHFIFSFVSNYELNKAKYLFY